MNAKKNKNYIHAISVYDYNPASPISHQYECVIVIVYWTDNPDKVIQEIN